MYTEGDESILCTDQKVKVTAELKGTCDYAKYDTYNMCEQNTRQQQHICWTRVQ